MPTLKEVADLAGVSAGTVSRVLNRAKGIEELTPDCISRVEVAAQKLGYQANFIARSFKQGRSFGIGIVCPRPHGPLHPFHAALSGAADTAVRAAGYHSVIVSPSGEESPAESAIRFLREGRVDGVLIPYFLGSEQDRSHLETLRKPVVVIGSQQRGPLPTVSVDDCSGIQNAVIHLAQLGHRHIAWLGPDNHERAAARRDACMETAKARGIECDVMTIAFARGSDISIDIETSRAAVEDRLRSDFSFTGVVCFNDVIALGACAAISRSKLSVPHDISVIGFDDLLGQVAYPTMTTVSHMLAEISAQAVRHVIDMSTDDSAWDRLRFRSDVIQPELIVRNSTAAPRSR